MIENRLIIDVNESDSIWTDYQENAKMPVF